MTKTNFTQLIFFSLLLILATACKNEFDSSGRNRNEQNHDYKGDSKTRLQDKYQNNDHTSLLNDGSNRWIWQKPNMIIDKIGPLDSLVIADIGAGPNGYFSLRIANQVPVEKVIAMDIDQGAIDFMERLRMLLPEEIQTRFETRLVEADNAKLNSEEVDVVLIVNTAVYFENRVEYFKHLLDGIAPNGKIVIIDFKKRNTPLGPDISMRVALGEIESDLADAGYKRIDSDDRTLEYQYIVTAYKE